VKAENINNSFNIIGLINSGLPLLISRELSKGLAKNANIKAILSSKDSDRLLLSLSEESSEEDLPNISQLAKLTGERLIRKKKQKKDYTKILPLLLVSLRSSRRPIKKAESQNTRNKIARDAKEKRRKEHEAKANYTGLGRTKKHAALATTLQLLNGLNLPFRSSQ
jgi:hypothetical protein